MIYAEASKLGGPEVLTVIEKDTPRPGKGMLLVEGAHNALLAEALWPTMIEKNISLIGFNLEGRL